MAPLGQTIAVIDKSGKVVSTTKQLFGVFHHAKNAYQERKSKFDSERNAKIAEQQALRGLANYNIDDSKSVGSRRSRRSKTHHHSSRSHHRARPSSYYEQDSHSVTGAQSYSPPLEGLPRRHTHHDLTVREPERRPTTARSKSDAHIDMDLAYGDAHPAALSRYDPPEPIANDQRQLKGLVNRAQWLLEEAHCVQHSATATIAHLQKNPEAMAAVALTLAEISNLVRKMAPGALSALKSVAPTVFALLSSPQFLIAAGVGIGVTVVMFGGYKIIKKIQSGNEKTDQSTGMDEVMELNQSCSRVEMWRRGVADVEAASVGTSVDGEFITPRAAALSGIDVTTARMERDPRLKSPEDDSVTSSHRFRRSRTSRAHHSTSRSKKEPDSVSTRPSGLFAKSKHQSKSSSRGPNKASSKTGVSVSEKEKRPKEKKKKGPSRLRLMFTP